MTHHAKEPGGLDADALNLSDGGANVKLFERDGWFMRGEEKVVQVMHTVDADGKKVQKGRKSILTERDIFKNHCGNDLKKYVSTCVFETVFLILHTHT